MASKAKVAVIGAGPAGLIAGLVGARLGLDVSLYEQARDFRRIGGGILIHSNGQRVLDALGLLDSFRPRVFSGQQMTIERPDGRVLSTYDYRRVPVPHNTGAVVMRYDLQEHLVAALARAGVPLHFDARCEDVVRTGRGAGLRFADGRALEADVVIAADGIHSRGRSSLGLPVRRYGTGEAYVRGVAEMRPGSPLIREIWGRDGRRFGICPLPGDRVYFYAVVPFGGWAEILERGLEAWIDGWRDHGPEVMAVLRAVPDWRRVNYDELHEVWLERWYAPPVFVMGDAAHAMTPHVGQGVSSAMMDAVVLMQLLAGAAEEGGGLEAVGQRYESIRRPYVSRVQALSRRLGFLAGRRRAGARWVRDAALPLMGRIEAIERPVRLRVAGFNPAEEPFLRLAGQGVIAAAG